jgi:HEAT repeat protein
MSVILRVAAIAEAFIIAALVVVQVVSAFASRQVRRRSAEAARTGELLFVAMATKTIDTALTAKLRRLPPRWRDETIGNLALNVSSGEDRVLIDIAEAVGVIARARRGLTSRRWSRRLVAARTLRALGVHDAVARRLLADREPAVRAAAALWLSSVDASPGTAEDVARLLTDRNLHVRHAAREALIRMGMHATQLVAALLVAGQPETRCAALGIALGMPHPDIHAAARSCAADDDPRVRASAMGVLATSAAELDAAIVIGALDDPDGRVRSAAARALGAMRAVTALRSLSRVSRLDADADVREAATRALQQLGPAGKLTVQALTGPANEPIIREVARVV